MIEVEFGMDGRLARMNVLYGESIELYEDSERLFVEAESKGEDGRVVLTQQHAAALWPLLQCFAETGRLTRTTATESENQR